MIMTECFFLFFSSSLPNLDCLHCKPDSVWRWLHLGAEAHITEMNVPIGTNVISEF